MGVAYLMAVAASALQAQPLPIHVASAAMRVGATVVRPQPQPAIAIGPAAVTIGNAADVSVSAEGGVLRRTAGGGFTLAPRNGGPVRITLTY